MIKAPRGLAGALLAIGIAASALAAPSNPAASPLTYNTSTGYYNPPSFNSMVMVNITFNGYNLSWEPASYDFTVGPLLKTAPSNGTLPAFDPSQPWSVLNGTAFSRQLGWFDNVNDDFNGVHQNPGDFGLIGQPPLPSADSVWIQRLPQSSPQLKTYAVSEGGDPYGPYTPIFGTNGSSTKWQWDGFMDHNVNAVSLSDLTMSNQVFTGVYKLYIGDSVGNEVLKADHVTPMYGSTTITWKWIGPPHPGDANGDSAVDVIDLGVLATNYDTASGATWAKGVFNGDGAVNVIDLGILATNYDWVGVPGSAAVPEPGSAALLAMGALALLRRSTRK